MIAGLADALFGLSVAFSAAGVIVYFVVLFRRPTAVRLLNGSGLFFTSVALAQIALVIRNASLGPVYNNAAWVVILLCAAILMQAAAALRNRSAWDGTERRSDETTPSGTR